MKTIKIIDLLNKIANGEEVPQKIWLRRIWRVPMIYNKKDKDYYYEGNPNGFFADYFLPYNRVDFDLNEEVEIIEEEKEIEHLQSVNGKEDTLSFKSGVDLLDKLNEVIDVVNELKRGNN